MHLSDPKELSNSLRAPQKIILGSLATRLRFENRARADFALLKSTLRRVTRKKMVMQ